MRGQRERFLFYADTWNVQSSKRSGCCSMLKRDGVPKRSMFCSMQKRYGVPGGVVFVLRSSIAVHLHAVRLSFEWTCLHMISMDVSVTTVRDHSL